MHFDVMIRELEQRMVCWRTERWEVRGSCAVVEESILDQLVPGNLERTLSIRRFVVVLDYRPSIESG